jgi:hypothetical protein
LIAKVDYGRRCQMGDVHTTRMRCGLGRVREYGVSFAINSIARVVEYTLSNYPMHAIDSESLDMRHEGCGPRAVSVTPRSVSVTPRSVSVTSISVSVTSISVSVTTSTM